MDEDNACIKIISMYHAMCQPKELHRLSTSTLGSRCVSNHCMLVRELFLCAATQEERRCAGICCSIGCNIALALSSRSLIRVSSRVADLLQVKVDRKGGSTLNWGRHGGLARACPSRISSSRGREGCLYPTAQVPHDAT